MIRHRYTLRHSFYSLFTAHCSLSLSAHAQQTPQPLSCHPLTSHFSGYLQGRRRVAQASACALSSPQPRSTRVSSFLPLIPFCELSASQPSSPHRQFGSPSTARNPLLLPMLSTNHQPLLTKPFTIRTSKKQVRNPFRIRTYKTQDLKPFRMNTYKKTGEGVGQSLLTSATPDAMRLERFHK